MNANVDAGAAPTAFDIQNNNGSSWTTFVTTVRNATNIQATGITAFGDFAAGERCNNQTAISYTGSPYCILGAQPQLY